MKLLKKNISAKDGSGAVLLRPETPEDLWHSYNLLQVGDLVRCTTLRKVVKESSTGSTSSNKVRMSLTIEVTKVDFDPSSLQVRLSGPNREESEHVRMGAHHTLTLELDRNFSIEKSCWDQIFLDRIEEACHPERAAELAAVVMSPGLAHLCLASSGHKHALDDIFSDPAIMSQITETKVAKEVMVLNKFMRMIDLDPDRAFYGYEHVRVANEQSAVDSLLVTDELFRNSDLFHACFGDTVATGVGSGCYFAVSSPRLGGIGSGSCPKRYR
eukprot:scaffold13078_cov48-Attheya_sp.AAC.3